MKRFLIWIIIFIVFIVSFWVGAHFYLAKNPKKIAVAIDTSYFMNQNWGSVVNTVKNIANQKYSTYCLLTDKQLIHSWNNELLSYKLGSIKPYGPRDLAIFYDNTRYKEINEATVIYIITNDDKFEVKNTLKYKLILLR
ncbi:MAG: hypothetical protein A2086_01085 [Spirochaetes bacterium GWD1_27_9]|nr:MAG: hypothetical protein A2Z98_16015 [Spirochaetes bacterium GWB1_27_13]OHD33646.1 MAG: hypothetical protein A2086_01085 [Spirochaetes bacterium GWD1_27_9]